MKFNSKSALLTIIIVLIIVLSNEDTIAISMNNSTLVANRKGNGKFKINKENQRYSNNSEFHDNSNYIESDSIYIHNDEDLLKYNFTGNGSFSNPYIISNLAIKNKVYGMNIANIKKVFVIRNCLFSNVSNEAVHISNITGIVLEYNKFEYIEQAIIIRKSTNITVRNNTIYNSDNTAIAVTFCNDGPYIVNNSIFDVYEGIIITDSNKTTVINNFVSRVIFDMVWTDWTSYRNEIHHNYFLRTVKLGSDIPLAHDDGKYNNWDNNYWSDYSGQGEYISSYDRIVDHHPLTAIDSDNDSIVDPIERFLGLGYLNPDTDADNLTDGEEIISYLTDPLSTDTDGDNLTDGEEIKIYGTDPLSTDTDGDGLDDYFEINTIHTNPLSSDTDGDGYSDFYEYTHHTNPRWAFSNDKTNLIALGVGVMIPIVALIIFIMRRATLKKETKLHFIFDSWEQLYNEWDTIIEKINNSTKTHLTHVTFEIKTISSNNIDLLNEMVRIIEEAQALVSRQITVDLKDIIKVMKKNSGFAVRLNGDLMEQALKAINAITKNTLLTSVKDYLWMRYIYLIKHSDIQSDSKEIIEFIDGNVIFNKFVNFLISSDIDDKLNKEIRRMSEELKYQFSNSQKLNFELLGNSIKVIGEKFIDKFEALKEDLLRLKSNIEITYSEIENLKLSEPEKKQLEESYNKITKAYRRKVIF